MYDALFELEISLCKVFPALTPFQIGRESFHDVVILVYRMARYNEYKQNPGSGGGSAPGTMIVRRKNGDTITMRPARDNRKW